MASVAIPKGRKPARVGHGTARLVLGEEVLHLPRGLLPADAREGQWLRISVALTPAPPDDTAALRKRLGESDPGGDIKL